MLIITTRQNVYIDVVKVTFDLGNITVLHMKDGSTKQIMTSHIHDIQSQT